MRFQAAPACLYRLAALLSWATFCSRNFSPGRLSNSIPEWYDALKNKQSSKCVANNIEIEEMVPQGAEEHMHVVHGEAIQEAGQFGGRKVEAAGRLCHRFHTGSQGSRYGAVEKEISQTIECNM